jgi:hypothetical protein
MIILLISQCCDSHLSGANSSNPEPSLQPFMIYEKVQGTGKQGWATSRELIAPPGCDYNHCHQDTTATDTRRICGTEDDTTGFSVDSFAVDTVYLYRYLARTESSSLSSSLV